jgi:hypothetical protein
MTRLLLCEWRRFARWAVVVAMLNLAALFLLGRVADPLRWSDQDQLALLVLCMFFGAALAAIQVGAYRKPSQWVWLIHRPLEPGAIFAALSIAAVAILAAVIAVPTVLWLAATDLATERVVDLRDYLSPASTAVTCSASNAGKAATTPRSCGIRTRRRSLTSPPC